MALRNCSKCSESLAKYGASWGYNERVSNCGDKINALEGWILVLGVLEEAVMERGAGERVKERGGCGV